MMLPMSLSKNQYAFLNSVFLYFTRNGEWPTFHYIDKVLLAQDIDIEEVVEEFNRNDRNVFYWQIPSLPQNELITLDIPAIKYCDALHTSNIFTAFAIVIRWLAKEYYHSMQLPDSKISFTSDEILNKLQFLAEDELIVKKIGMLISRNGDFYSTYGSDAARPNWWSITLTRRIMKYKDISTIDDYLSIRYEKKQQNTTTFIIQNPYVDEIGNPPEIEESIKAFRGDYPDPSRVGFIMMSFKNTEAHARITQTIKAALQSVNLIGIRADDKEYHSSLFPNILTYMYGCGFGIAVFERIEDDTPNPNVALEVGYMRALRKPVCYLRDKTLKMVQVDLIGELYKMFDVQNIETSIDVVLRKWLADKSLSRLKP